MYPKTSLQPGQTGSDVKKLQDFLVSRGYLSQAQVNSGYGTYGPQTTAAVKAFQKDAGVDSSSGPGYWGPKTIAAAGGISGGGVSGSGKSDPRQPLTDEEYESGAKNNPKVQELSKYGNSMEEILSALETGDISGLRSATGEPFKVEDQQKALEQAQELDKAYYEALKQKETKDTELALAQKQADYQNYLLTSGQNFEKDKVQADQTAADRGVLFSGGRYQKEKNLERTYNQEQAAKFGTMSRDIQGLAGDYQYKYGEDPAKKLSQYYKLGQNTYNANVSQGGVGSEGLSSVYAPKSYDYKGTRLGEQVATANKKAAGLLWNKGNKLVATGYNNKY